MRKSIKYLLIIINIVFAMVYIAACFATRISPASHSFYPILGLFYPVWLFMNIGFVIFWLVLRKIYLLISLGIILLFFPLFFRQVEFHFKQHHEENSIKIMTWNVKNFDLYNWSHNKDTRKEMMDLIASVHPDVLCLQEFYNEDKGNFQNLDYITNQLGYPYSYFSSSVNLRDNEHWGVATFSKFPIMAKDSTRDFAISTDLNINGTSVRLFNVHLQSIYFNDDDYKYINQVKEIDPDMQSSKRILGKLRNGYIKRTSQVKLLRNEIIKSDKPVILCGDFNDTPVSYTYEQLSKGLQDSFKKRGKFFGKTYNGNIPLLRIDYIFLAQSFNVISHQVIHKGYSDHFPVVCEFSLK